MKGNAPAHVISPPYASPSPVYGAYQSPAFSPSTNFNTLPQRTFTPSAHSAAANVPANPRAFIPNVFPGQQLPSSAYKPAAEFVPSYMNAPSSSVSGPNSAAYSQSSGYSTLASSSASRGMPSTRPQQGGFPVLTASNPTSAHVPTSYTSNVRPPAFSVSTPRQMP